MNCYLEFSSVVVDVVVDDELGKCSVHSIAAVTAPAGALTVGAYFAFVYGQLLQEGHIRDDDRTDAFHLVEGLLQRLVPVSDQVRHHKGCGPTYSTHAVHDGHTVRQTSLLQLVRHLVKVDANVLFLVVRNLQGIRSIVFVRFVRVQHSPARDMFARCQA